MRSNAADNRTPAISRRTFLQGVGLALAAGFTSIGSRFLDWLMRICRLDGDLSLAGAG